jgi:hypothetical protein
MSLKVAVTKAGNTRYPPLNARAAKTALLYPPRAQFIEFSVLGADFWGVANCRALPCVDLLSP